MPECKVTVYVPGTSARVIAPVEGSIVNPAGDALYVPP
jgi:hypothetical protein